MRVPDFLAEQRVPFETLWHPPAFTAQQRAKYLGVPGRQVAKSVLLVGPSGFLLAVLPAPRLVDTEVLARELNGPVRLATHRELADLFCDCEWGVVPPFGAMYGLPTLLDDELNPEACIVFEGKSHVEAVRLLCRDFERLERPRRLHFSRP
jgi:Ala-tRNA(Pro) deacylase